MTAFYQDLRRVEEELQIAEKEIQELEAELGQERTLREGRLSVSTLQQIPFKLQLTVSLIPL